MEWTVVSVIVVIAGLIGTVAVPLSKNTKAMTQLSERINHLVYRMDKDGTNLAISKASLLINIGSFLIRLVNIKKA